MQLLMNKCLNPITDFGGAPPKTHLAPGFAIFSCIDLGPLHTRAKSRDHEIVRAQKKVSKGRPNTPPTSCSVVMDPQVYCEAICDRALNQRLF